MLSSLILKIPNKIGKKLTIVLLVFMILNSTITGVVVYRWKERVSGVPSSNAITDTIDNLYPNDRMQKIFANLTFK